MAARRKVGKGKARKRSTRGVSAGRPPVASVKSRGKLGHLAEELVPPTRSGRKSPPSAPPEYTIIDRAAEIIGKVDGDLTEVGRQLDGNSTDPDLQLLTTRRRRFVEEFLICGNATKAAELAGFSPNRAEVEGCELLKDPIVAGVIARREANIYARLGITQERLLTERAAIALADLGDVFTQRTDGVPQMKPLDQWPPMVRKAIKTIKVKRTDAKFTETSYEPAYDIIELSLWDKPAQLEKIELRLEADRKRGDTAESMTEKQRVRKIAEILSRGKAAMDAAKKQPKKKAS